MVVWGSRHIMTSMVGSWVKNSIFSAKWPAGLLAGKIWCQRRRQIGIPIGFIGWERLGKEREILKMENCDIFLQRKLMGLWNFEWKFRMGNSRVEIIGVRKSDISEVILLEGSKMQMRGEESPRKHTKRDIKHQPTNQWKDMFGCLT